MKLVRLGEYSMSVRSVTALLVSVLTLRMVQRAPEMMTSVAESKLLRCKAFVESL